MIAVHENGLIAVQMANGYEVDAHLSRELMTSGARFSTGQQLLVEFSPYNMTQARILGVGSTT